MNDKLSKGRRIGEGAYGVVYGAKDREGNSLAVKRLLVDATNTFIGSIREADMVARLKHPHIVNADIKSGAIFNGPLTPVDNKYAVRDDNITFVMERADGDAYEYFSKPRSLHEFKTYLVHILLALEYMHAKGITHQDMKPQNILYFKTNTIPVFKVSDLGLAYWNNRYGYQSITASTSWYRAPEISEHKYRYNHMVDMWSVGCMMCDIIFGRALLQDITEDKDSLILQGYEKLVPGCGGNITWEMFWSKKCHYNFTTASVKEVYRMRDLLQNMLAYNPLTRISAAMALNHPFFSDFKEYISNTRSSFYHVDECPRLGMTPCMERQFAIGIASNLLTNLYQEIVGEHFRPLFHAMMLFDRALQHNLATVKPRYTKITEHNGLHWSFDGTIVRFMVCYYIVYKYFGLLKPIPNWNGLLLDKYCTPEFTKLAEEFERYVIVDVCKYQIYQHTPIDLAGLWGIQLTERDIVDLYHYYINNMWDGASSEIILESFFRHRHQSIIRHV